MITYTQVSGATKVEVLPDVSAKGSVIWLHGLGANGHDFASIVPQLHLPAHLPLRFVFPHAPLKPVTINNGHIMRAWFDIYSMRINQRIDQTGIADSVNLLDQLIRNEHAKGIPTEKIILGGFSQGAVIALMAGLSYPQKLAGVIALSGYLPNAAQVLMNRSQANQAIPVFLAHGTEDTIVPFMLGQTTATALEKQGLPVTWHSYKMSHSVCAVEVRDIAEWLELIF